MPAHKYSISVALCIFSVLSYLNFVPGLFYLRAGYQGISIKFLGNTLFSKQVLFFKPPFASKGSLTSMSFLGIIRYLSTELLFSWNG